MLKKITNHLRRIAKDRSGNFALLTAILALPMILMVGMAVDFAHSYEIKTSLDQYADAAAVAAINTTSKAYFSSPTESIDPNWNKEAENFFRGNLQGFEYPITISPLVTRNGSTITASIEYSVKIPTYFLKIAGMNEITLSGNAHAQFQVGNYYNINILVDNSPSMGIGATLADISLMMSKMPQGCAFACHDLSGQLNYIVPARALGVNLRIDVVSRALQSLADYIAKDVTQKKLYQLSLYSLGARAEDAVVKPLLKVQSPTRDMTVFSDAAKSVQLMTLPIRTDVCFHRCAQSDLNQAIKLMGGEIPAPGDGSTAASPRQVLLFITDGVNDIETTGFCYGAVPDWNRCTEYVDVAACKALKDRGIVIAILHTQYFPLTSRDDYKNSVGPFAELVGPKLQECATSNLYKLVDPKSDIISALHDLFRSATTTPRLLM